MKVCVPDKYSTSLILKQIHQDHPCNQLLKYLKPNTNTIQYSDVPTQKYFNIMSEIVFILDSGVLCWISSHFFVWLDHAVDKSKENYSSFRKGHHSKLQVLIKVRLLEQDGYYRVLSRRFYASRTSILYYNLDKES